MSARLAVSQQFLRARARCWRSVLAPLSYRCPFRKLRKPILLKPSTVVAVEVAVVEIAAPKATAPSVAARLLFPSQRAATSTRRAPSGRFRRKLRAARRTHPPPRTPQRRLRAPLLAPT